MDWQSHMSAALEQAHLALDSGDVPIGALLVNAEGEVIATGHNLREAHGDATAHAEVVAIREASTNQKNWNLEDCTLVVTLEPCVMCAGAIKAARIGRVVFGAWDEIAGASGSLYDILRDARLGKPVEVVGGVLEQPCSAILTDFFKARRV